MIRALVVLGLLLWAGTALVLAELRWFRRPSLVERLRPYSPGGLGQPATAGVLSVATFGEALGPLASGLGERLARLLGVGEEAEVRLRRVHADLDAVGFRVRQVGWSTAALGAGALLAAAAGLPGPAGLLVVVVAPALAFLVLEQQLAARSARWQRHLFLELPVVAEQLALLLAAGWSLTAALHRLAERGTGCASRDLGRVCSRLRQGLSEAAALQEWSTLARVPAVERLVAVLVLNRDTADLARLVTEEARATRRDVHRELIESVERRNQQVWIPVTVATLVPGVLFLAIPFVDALRLFGT